MILVRSKADDELGSTTSAPPPPPPIYPRGVAAMGTLTADVPRLDAHCSHKLPTSCRLTSTPLCCACEDKRPHSPTYRIYIDGVGFVQRGTRWQSYCWFCKSFWDARVAASGLPATQTRIPEAPDQVDFVKRWFEFHQGYRIVQTPDGREQRVAVVGEPLKDVNPGHLPRTLDELRAGLPASSQITDTMPPVVVENAPSSIPQPSIEDTLNELLDEAMAEAGTAVQQRSIPVQGHEIAHTAPLPIRGRSDQPQQPQSPIIQNPAQARLDQQYVEAQASLQEAERLREEREADLGSADAEVHVARERLRRLRRQQISAGNFAQVFGTRDDIQNEDYVSPITRMFTRVSQWGRQLEEQRRALREQQQALDNYEEIRRQTHPTHGIVRSNQTILIDLTQDEQVPQRSPQRISPSPSTSPPIPPPVSQPVSPPLSPPISVSQQVSPQASQQAPQPVPEPVQQQIPQVISQPAPQPMPQLRSLDPEREPVPMLRTNSSPATGEAQRRAHESAFRARLPPPYDAQFHSTPRQNPFRVPRMEERSPVASTREEPRATAPESSPPANTNDLVGRLATLRAALDAESPPVESGPRTPAAQAEAFSQRAQESMQTFEQLRGRLNALRERLQGQSGNINWAENHQAVVEIRNLYAQGARQTNTMEPLTPDAPAFDTGRNFNQLRAQQLLQDARDTLARVDAGLASQSTIKGLDGDERPEAKSDEAMTFKLECRVCYSQIADTACLPCGHLAMCQWCADQYVPVKEEDRTRPRDKHAKCPMCRGKVKQRVKIFPG